MTVVPETRPSSESQVLLSVTLPLVRKVGADDDTPRQPRIKQWRPKAQKSDVARVIRRFVALEFDLRSAAGRLVLDESHVLSREVPDADEAGLDVRKLTWAELEEHVRGWHIQRRETVMRWKLRQLVTAPPELPAHLVLRDGTPVPRAGLSRREAVSNLVARGGSTRNYA